MLWAAILASAVTYTDTGGIQVGCIEAGNPAVEIVVGAGALHEEEGTDGAAHVLEHMLLRPLGYDDNNGTTEWDFTNYFASAPSTELSTKAVDLIRAVRTFNERDFEKEKQVVLRELERGAGAYLTDTIFADTLFDRRIGGTEQTVSRLDLATLRRFHERYYVKGNIAVNVRGAPDCETFRRRIEPELAEFAEGPAAKKPAEQSDQYGRKGLPNAPDRFVEGFYFLDEPVEAHMALRVVGAWFQERALADLRADKGITYSPQARFTRMGGAGLLLLEVETKEPGTAAEWYQDTLNVLVTAKSPRTEMKQAFRQVGERFGSARTEEALAAIRGERMPREALAGLDDATLRPLLGRLLAQKRSVGTGGFGLGAQVALLFIGLIVLGFFGVVVRILLGGRS